MTNKPGIRRLFDWRRENDSGDGETASASGAGNRQWLFHRIKQSMGGDKCGGKYGREEIFCQAASDGVGGVSSDSRCVDDIVLVTVTGVSAIIK